MTVKTFSNLSGKILIASPYVLYGDVFYQSLIYMLSHTNNGSIGLIVNHLVNHLPFKSLFKAMNEPPIGNLTLPVYLGGPVEVERGFFLHSGDYNKNLLFKFPNNLAVSSNTQILTDIVGGDGPQNSLFMIGYTGWEAGQLEFELENNLWIVSDCDRDIIFHENNAKKWGNALIKLGIDDAHFAASLGHC